MTFRVLNLVTNDDAQFFQEQVRLLEERGVETTTVAVPGNPARDDDLDGGRPLSSYFKFYPPVLWESFGEYDLIHANYGLTLPAALAQPNLPVVASLWGSDLLGEYGPLTELCARHCEEVIVMSDEMAAELDRDCRVIPHGVDMEKFAPMDRRRACEELSWDPDGAHLFFPYGERRDVKNYPRAQRIAERVDDELDRPVTLHKAKGVPHDRMSDYMNAADAMLLTSKREGSPNTVKEAMACNLPVVATDVGDVAQRLDGVTNSTVVETDDEFVDAVIDVIESGERADGREKIRPISAQRMGDRICEVYREVTGRDVPTDGSAGEDEGEDRAPARPGVAE